MPVDCIVRVSFNNDKPAYPAVDLALVGDELNATGTGPFTKIGTACYSCSGKHSGHVLTALLNLGQALQFADIDFLSITMASNTTELRPLPELV